MIAAVYARKSTEQFVADDQKSVARQIAHAREYAERKGWMVDDRYVYVDDGISGAEFDRRPGFVRLMTALKPRAPFQVLVMSEESRLGRESIETAYALKQLIVAGVRVFFYLEERERTLDSPIEKAMLALQTMADEMERDKARQRAHDKAQALARAGYVTGGQCFGYDNVPIVGANGARSHVEYRINEREAAIVRRLFELAAIGYGQAMIAKLLNAEGVPAPRSQQGRPRAWIASSVHAVLFRKRYRGEIVWNQTKKRDRWGQHRASDRSEDEWVCVPAPHLRIVPEALWQAAHARIAASRSAMNLYRGRGSASRYLLPGLARCAWCQGGMYVRTRTRANGADLRLYGCSSHYHRGESVCGNAIVVPMEVTDRAVLAKIGDLLTPDLAEEVIGRLRELVEAQAAADPRAPVAAELAGVETQIDHLTEAIAMGGAMPTLVQRLHGLDERRQTLAETLDTMPGPAPHPRVEWPVLAREARQMLQQWRDLLHDDVGDTRRVLRELLDGPLRFTPMVEGARRGYRFEGALTIGGILAGSARSFEWRPRAESNCRPSA
jgi:site-specific DNA recombinase